MARHFANDVRDPDRAVILIDPKGPLAELCLGLAPARPHRPLPRPRPARGRHQPARRSTPAAGARAAVFLQALIEANPPGAIQAASDSFLRQAIYAVCLVEPRADALARLPHARLRRARRTATSSSRRLDGVDGRRLRPGLLATRSSPPCVADRGYAAQALNPPRNKIERLISTREIDTLLRHPFGLDLDGDPRARRGPDRRRRQGQPSARTTRSLVTQLLLQLLHRALQAQQNLPEAEQRRVSLLIDEAHNVLTPSVAKMLAEGRSAGLEAVFAWQYSAQIRDEVIRSGVRSLLQSMSIFRMREMEDARSLAGLAMEVYSDRISVDQDEQERLRFSPDDIVKLPIHRAINLWVADGVPRAGLPRPHAPDGGPAQRRASPSTTSTPSASAAATTPSTCPIRSRDLPRGKPQAARRATRPRDGGAQAGAVPAAASTASAASKQLTFIDVTEADDPDGL